MSSQFDRFASHLLEENRESQEDYLRRVYGKPLTKLEELERLSREMERLAYNIPAPNPVTPQMVTLCQYMQSLISNMVQKEQTNDK